MSTAVEVNEYRVGRNFVRVGDRVHVKPSQPGKKDGFDTAVRRILANPDGTPQAVEVIDPRNGAVRTLRPERIERKTQTKGGKKIEVSRPRNIATRAPKAARR